MKLTEEQAYERLRAALAILGEEDCEDWRVQVRMNHAKILLKRCGEGIVTNPAYAANDTGNSQ